MTMYTSDPTETDETPLITANGEKVGKGTIACPNWLDFGTKVVIEGVDYVCNDRMHKRYRDGNYFDVWTEEKTTAYHWGRKQVIVSIYE